MYYELSSPLIHNFQETLSGAYVRWEMSNGDVYDYMFTASTNNVRFGFLFLGQVNADLMVESNRPSIIACSNYPFIICSSRRFYISGSYNYDYFEYNSQIENDVHVFRRRIVGFSESRYLAGYYGYNTFANLDTTTETEILSGLGKYTITYRLTNCTAPTAPTEAFIGDTVNVPFVFPDGYGFPNPATDVYVYNNGVLVPSSYANNVLTFTMPDPS